MSNSRNVPLQTVDTVEQPSDSKGWIVLKTMGRGAAIVGGAILILSGLAASGIGLVTLPFGLGVPVLSVGLGLIGAGAALGGFGTSGLLKKHHAMPSQSNKWSLSGIFSGVVVAALGAALCATGFGAVIGAPLIALGALMIGAGIARYERKPSTYDPLSQIEDPAAASASQKPLASSTVVQIDTPKVGSELAITSSASSAPTVSSAPPKLLAPSLSQ